MAEWDAERVELWVRSQAERDETHGPATEKMLDMANIKAGYRVLDVAVGAGGSTLLAARRVGPNGYVLAIDTSANMLNAAAEATQGAGLTNVETRVMAGENLDCPRRKMVAHNQKSTGNSFLSRAFLRCFMMENNWNSESLGSILLGIQKQSTFSV